MTTRSGPDGWGVSGLIELEVELGDHTVNLGRLAESALEERLNRQLNLVSLHAESSHQETRLSVARLRFALDDATDETEQALAQAMRGDVRLAQALAQRGQGGVVAAWPAPASRIACMNPRKLT